MELNRNSETAEKKINISFSPPDISEEEIREVTDTLRSGWITTGPKVKALEALLTDYTGADGCVCLNSQTAAGEMSLRLLGIGKDSCGIDGIYGSEEDEVITCAYTYTASASVICHVGAKPVLVDCREGSVEMDYDALERAVNEHTKAVIPVDLGGIPCDYDRIFEILERKKGLFHPSNKLQKAIGRVAVVEDAAHALGASYKGRTIGSIADFTNFSFHAVKNFTTAEGGALAWKLKDRDAEEIYHRLQLFSLHGQSKDALAKTKLGSWEYDIVGPWYKCNMTDIMGAMGMIDWLVPFLNLLCVIIPPITGAMLADFYLLGNADKYRFDQMEKIPNFRADTSIGAIFGCLVGLCMNEPPVGFGISFMVRLANVVPTALVAMACSIVVVIAANRLLKKQ